MELTTIGLTLVSYLALGFATMSGTLLGNFGCITVNGLGYISCIYYVYRNVSTTVLQKLVVPEQL